MSDLAWNIQLSDTQVWQRQQVLVEVSVKANDPFALLKTDKLSIPGMVVKPLPLLNDDKTHQLTLRWQLYPQGSGKYQIQLPPIRYYLNGGTKEKWQVPVQTIDVQALPPYIPPTLPVGAVKIESIIEPKGVLTPDTLVYWHLKLRSKTVPVEQFPPILKQIKNAKGLDVLPATVVSHSGVGLGDDDDQHSEKNLAPYLYQLDYHIPLKATASGRLDLPTIKWHWFNPKTARLEQQKYQADRPWVLALWEKIILSLIALFATALILFKLIKWGLKVAQQAQSKRDVLRLLKVGDDSDAISKAMRKCAKTHGWSIQNNYNFSHKKWLQHWQDQYGKDLKLQSYVIRHEKKLFSK